MADCDICRIMENASAFKVVYEDKDIIAILHESPAVPGHTMVIPKKHYSIFEDVPDDVVKNTFSAANIISTVVFEALGAQGTNIIVNNGLSAGQEHAHFLVHVLPRKENDGLNLEWTPKRMSDDGLKTTQSMIKTFADIVFSGKEQDISNVRVKKEEHAERPAAAHGQKDEENYLVKQLRRVP